MRKVESNDNFQARGKSGEYGAYQYTPDTWNARSKKYGVNVPLEQATPEQQNEVQYKWIKEMKDKGYNIGQIASMHNAGEGRPNAYQENFRGTNQYGVEFDVPAYARKVAEQYQQMKGQAPQATPTQPLVARETPKKNEKEDKSLIRKVAEFAFPILEEKERTPLQTLGDLGLSALWFVPAGGVAASAGLRALGLGAKAAKIGGAIATGAGIGYGADVSQKLSEGEKGLDVLKPGLGTVLGAGTAGLASRVAGRYSQKGILDSISKENNAVFGQTKRGANELAESFSKSKDPGAFLAERGINLKQLIDPETVAYTTKETAEKVAQDASTINKVLTDSLKRIPGAKPVAELEQELLAKVPKNHPERADIVKREMQLLRQQYGDLPSAADLNEWKQRAWGLGKFDMAVPSDTRLTYRMIGNQLKTEVESLAKKGGAPDVGALNELIGSHLDAADMLEFLNGTKAKGGRLGNLLNQQTLMTVGGIGGFAGAGPIGALAGLVASHYGAKALATLVRKIEGQPIKSAILNRMERETPDIVRQFEQFAKTTPSALETIKRQLAERGIDIFKEAAITTPKVLSPKPQTPGAIQGLITTVGARGGAGI